MKVNKLVRDNVPDIIRADNRTPSFHIAADEEYAEALQGKLQEEVAEFLSKPGVEEVVDIMDVLFAICELKNIDLDEMEAVGQKKAEIEGLFEKRIILEDNNYIA